ncbi:MAG: hypothetical protein HN927_02100 [Candidatus Marinimicrobia bacterium]|jgi:uncharacterized membrane protein SirB2|nr:hypothetical protein [Candidatus Neomarinimicrobiota bacterium]MBT3947737.1 hypothetical protein [Candidatus Neomarinimicrobiota bacterium]MBT4063845.1 hypothetical protein [Candidatus Neomarinimicrobiota bacterium]MBT4307876.1 hypothetical protein [Candidatus Neomarinimicrobiota bacterium]MBT4452662.1 hypothetical protein [Candidatus Neomarinimicrobiota bacterium]
MLSIKSFHIFFISISIIVTVGYGIWQLQNPSIYASFSTILGVLGLLSGTGLILYLQKVIKKFKTI